MVDMAKISTTHTVAGSNYQEVEVDVAGLDIQEIALAAESASVPPALCHACASGLSDPYLDEMTSFTYGGLEYNYVDGEWRPEGNESATKADQAKESGPMAT